MSENEKRIVASASFADSKPHYELLDGLRGAAALMVVWYHVFEGFAFAGGGMIETFNHGHLGVDFFFMLSGFVISYAYDDRWKATDGRKLTMGNFIKRRLIRLHPMLVMGAFIGLISFLISGCERWDSSVTPLPWVMLAFVMAALFIPAWPGAGYDVRGNGEMYSLNGPAWSLFFEYIGNIIYAIFLRRLSNKALFGVVSVIGFLWVQFMVRNVSGYESIGVGWTMDGVNFWGGLLRMLFPFSFGMLLARGFKPKKVRGIFWISILLLFGLFSVPFIPDFSITKGASDNCIYEVCCVAFVFPIIVYLAASGVTSDRASSRVCKFLGDISYPLYIVHYPVMYLFYMWLIKNKTYTLAETWPVVILVFCINVTLAYVCLKCYDEPVRRWLTRISQK